MSGTLTLFAWLGQEAEPPWQWDLRRFGWSLCQGRNGRRAECRHVMIADMRVVDNQMRLAMARADQPAWRLIMIGIEQPAERAQLLSLGCAEALSADISARELAARASRVNAMFSMLPRWRTLGPLTIDLFHRDARKGRNWLNLHPREFGVIWRLSDCPGETVSRRELLQDVWRIDHDPETNSVEVHISRLRAKLAQADCAHLVQTAPQGGYRLVDETPFMLSNDAVEADALDLCLQQIGWADEMSGLPNR